MDGLGKIKFDGPQQGYDIFGAANARFSTIYEFCKGDLTKEIYKDLIHNESNMRPSQLNELFKVSGLSDVCRLSCGKQPLLERLGETDQGKAHGKFLAALEDFFERRNDIAHALNSGQSSGPEQILSDIDLLESFGRALRESLDEQAPPPYERQRPLDIRDANILVADDEAPAQAPMPDALNQVEQPETANQE